MTEDIHHTQVLEHLTGPAGQAYRLEALHITPAQDASLAQWFLDLPRSHPFWDKYILGTVHLRDLPGVSPAQKATAWVEHEVLMYALDPSLKPVHTDRDTFRHLWPLNYVWQFAGLGDEKVVALARELARLFVAGQLIAEPQGIHGAQDLFKDVIRMQGGRIAE